MYLLHQWFWRNRWFYLNFKRMLTSKKYSVKNVRNLFQFCFSIWKFKIILELDSLLTSINCTHIVRNLAKSGIILTQFIILLLRQVTSPTPGQSGHTGNTGQSQNYTPGQSRNNTLERPRQPATSLGQRFSRSSSDLGMSSMKIFRQFLYVFISHNIILLSRKLWYLDIAIKDMIRIKGDS